MGNLTLNFFTNQLISSGVPLSCPPNWLHGKAKIYRPELLHLSYALAIPLQLSFVSPHLLATFTNKINFLLFRFWNSKGLPRSPLILKSKKLFIDPLSTNQLLFLLQIYETSAGYCHRTTSQKFWKFCSFFLALFIISPFSLFHFGLNEPCHFINFCLRREEFNHFSFWIHEEFSKVPRNNLCFSCFLIEKLTVISEKNEDRMSFLPIDLNLLQNREVNIELSLDKLLNFLRRSTFLPKELITGKSQDLKSSFSPSVMSFDHLRVVIRSKSSLASNIYNHDQLPISESLQIKGFAQQCADFEVEETLACWVSQRFAP